MCGSCPCYRNLRRRSLTPLYVVIDGTIMIKLILLNVNRYGSSRLNRLYNSFDRQPVIQSENNRARDWNSDAEMSMDEYYKVNSNSNY